MQPLSKQKGFTLPEVVVGLVLFGLLIHAVSQITASLQSQLRASQTKSQQLLNRDALVRRIQGEFQRAGYNFVTQKVSRIGDNPAKFAATAEYAPAANGVVTRTAAGTAAVQSLSSLEGVPGRMTVRLPAAGSLVVSDSNNHTHRLTALDSRLYFDQTVIGNYDPAAALLLDYRLNQTGRALKISSQDTNGATRKLFDANVDYTGTYLNFYAQITNSGDSLALSLNGQTVEQNDEYEPQGLPLYNGARMLYPVLVSSTSAVIFGGDEKSAVNFLSQNFKPGEDSALQTPRPAFGTYQTGDVLMIYDTAAARSALIRVTSTATAGNLLNIQFSAVSAESPAWNYFASSAADLQGSYPAGARVIKLAPPVTYAFSAGNLIRIEGNNQETLVSNIKSFTITEQVHSFTISGNLSKAGDNAPNQATYDAANLFTIKVRPDTFLNKN